MSRSRSNHLSDVLKPGVLGVGGVLRLKVGVRVTGTSHMIKPGVGVSSIS